MPHRIRASLAAVAAALLLLLSLSAAPAALAAAAEGTPASALGPERWLAALRQVLAGWLPASGSTAESGPVGPHSLPAATAASASPGGDAPGADDPPAPSPQAGSSMDPNG